MGSAHHLCHLTLVAHHEKRPVERLRQAEQVWKGHDSGRLSTIAVEQDPFQARSFRSEDVVLGIIADTENPVGR